MAETVTKIIDPDDDTGTDYTSLDAWEDATGGIAGGDLTADGGYIARATCRASSGTVDTARIWINGWTTGETTYILIEAIDGDEAVKTGWDTARYRLESTDDDAIILNEEYVRIHGLQLRYIYSSTGNKYVINISGVGTSDIRISNCRLLGDTDASGNSRAVTINDADATVYIYNNIIYDHDSSGINISNCTNTYVYNNVIYNCAWAGIDRTAGTVTAKNNAIFTTGNDFAGDITEDYNATDDDDGGGEHSFTPISWAAEFESYATGDFTLLPDGELYRAGADNPSGGIYTIDIEGDAYNSGAYSIGVDEPVAAGGSIVPIIVQQMRRRRG